MDSKSTKKNKKDKKKTRLEKIGMPVNYVRGMIITKNLKDLLAVVANANKETDWTKVKEKAAKGQKIVWPFDPIKVAENQKLVLKPTDGKDMTKEEKSEARKANRQAEKEFRQYEIIDGVHRFTLAFSDTYLDLNGKQIIDRNGKPQEAIPFETIKLEAGQNRFIEQYRTNVSHGARLDVVARWNFVNTLHAQYNMTQKQIEDETGIPQGTVSRILNSFNPDGTLKKRANPWGGKRKPRVKEATAANASTDDATNEWKVGDLIDHLENVCMNVERFTRPLSQLVREDRRGRYTKMIGPVKKLLSILTKGEFEISRAA